jgi:hypothetical protein
MHRWRLLLFLSGVFVLFTATASFASHALRQPDGDRLHWADNDPGFPRGYVYWHDETGVEWPVFASAIEWDKATRLDAVWVSGSNSCSSSHCVTVREVNFNNVGCSAPYGETDIPSFGSGHFTSNVEVRIDRQCDSRNAADRRELVCHELGHSIGLGERMFGADTCMRTGNMIGETLPDEHDFVALSTSYDHNDPG